MLGRNCSEGICWPTGATPHGAAGVAAGAIALLEVNGADTRPLLAAGNL